MPRALPGLLASLALACGGLSACTSGGPLGDIEVATGTNHAVFPSDERKPAPAFSGESLLDPDETITEASVAGQVAVLNFWGSWCGPCRAEEPILEEAHRAFGDEVAFLGVNTRRDQRAAAIAFIEEFDVSFPSVYDPSSRIAASFGVRVMPATFILDENGRIAVQIIGAVRSVEQLEHLIERARDDGS